MVSNGIALIIAGVGEDTEEFNYGATVEFGAHRLPIQYAGREKGPMGTPGGGAAARQDIIMPQSLPRGDREDNFNMMRK